MAYTAPEDLAIGHVHLKVSDLERSISFYQDVLGLALQQRYGSQAAFLSAGGYHHHLGLNTWESAGAGPAPKRAAGLYHVAFLYPDRASLARALAQVIAHDVPIEGAADHGISEALYLSDPDGNGIELYRDRKPTDWPRDSAGQLRMINAPLDIAALLAEA